MRRGLLILKVINNYNACPHLKRLFLLHYVKWYIHILIILNLVSHYKKKKKYKYNSPLTENCFWFWNALIIARFFMLESVFYYFNSWLRNKQHIMCTLGIEIIVELQNFNNANNCRSAQNLTLWPSFYPQWLKFWNWAEMWPLWCL